MKLCMDKLPDPDVLENLQLLLNMDLLEREAEWEIFLAIDNTPVREKPKKVKPPKEEPAK